MAPRKLIIDTDPGVDDAMAILAAFNSPDEFEVIGAHRPPPPCTPQEPLPQAPPPRAAPVRVRTCLAAPRHVNCHQPPPAAVPPPPPTHAHIHTPVAHPPSLP